MKTFKENTLEEALEKACAVFELSKENLKYVITETSTSLFFKSKRSVTIECPDINDLHSDLSNYLNSLLKLLGVDECSHTYSYDPSNDIIKWTMNPSEDNIGKVIGYKGYILSSLNVIARTFIADKYNHAYRILLNCSDYKDQKYDKLIRMTKRLAHQVQRSRVDVSLDPMTSDERRVVHNAIKSINYVETQSEGAGKYRHIVLKYNENKFVSKKNKFNKHQSEVSVEGSGEELNQTIDQDIE